MEKKNLLIVSHKIPYPLSQGGAIAQFYFLKEMTTNFNLSFCTILSNKNQIKNLENLKKEIPEISFKVYQIAKNSFKKDFFKYIRKLNRRISQRLSKAFKNDHVVTINKLDKNFEFVTEEFVDFFKTILEEEKYDIIQLEFFETLGLLPLIPNNIKKIVIHHEIRAKRISLLNTKNSIYKNYIQNITSVIENSLLKIANCVVVFNEEDKRFLNNVNSNTIVSPFGIPKQLIIKDEASSCFNKFIFIGSEFHYPNKEGLEWFLETIYLPSNKINYWPIHITGFWSEGFKKKYKDNDKVIFTGYLNKLDSIYENSVLVAPIISGSGIRTKILEAFSNKIPVISTPFASEGLYKVDEYINHIIHFNSALEFYEIFNKINKEDNFLINLANNGYYYFTTNFNEDKLFKQRLNAYFD